MTNTTMTVGDVRKAIKDLPDDMRVRSSSSYHPGYLECLSIEPKIVEDGIYSLLFKFDASWI